MSSIRVGLIVAAAFAVGACDSDPILAPGEKPVNIIGAPSELRQGDVAVLEANRTDPDTTITWSVAPAGAGHITADGRFVGYQPGTVRVIAADATAADTAVITITARGVSGSFSVVGRGAVTDRFTSDLWVHGDHAWTGTWSTRNGTLWGDRLYAWNIADPANPVRTDSVIVDARTVNDVKINGDGTLAVLTHEGSDDMLNGITLLDLSDPAHPAVITRFTDPAIRAGVHNVWIDGDFVYAVSGGLHIIDISDPSAPALVTSFHAGSSFVHDVYVRDGLAFVSHWNVGLVILDVGNGMSGGSPQQPVEVSRLFLDGETHNAWYWPARGYVFVGEEDGQEPHGIMHVVDASDLAAPHRVATYRVAGSEPHNFWLDEDRAIIYAAWYSEGLRAVDVSGELLGELERQGREIAHCRYGASTGCQAPSGTRTWAPQLHDGLVWVSDMNQGLVALRPSF
jgi:hypothetical protein